MSAISSVQSFSVFRFHNLSKRVVGETVIPGPDTQVYQQDPKNGLFYRESGNLLSCVKDGKLPQRIREGSYRGLFFELQRVGEVEQTESRHVTDRRANTVHRIVNPTNTKFAAMRWLNGDWLRVATPQYHEGQPEGVTVISWLGTTGLYGALDIDVSSRPDSKFTSRNHEDMLVELYEQAKQAYEDVQASAAS